MVLGAFWHQPLHQVRNLQACLGIIGGPLEETGISKYGYSGLSDVTELRDRSIFGNTNTSTYYAPGMVQGFRNTQRTGTQPQPSFVCLCLAKEEMWKAGKRLPWRWGFTKEDGPGELGRVPGESTLELSPRRPKDAARRPG